MKIREIKAMIGPNLWSIRRHKLIVMVLDLEEMEDKPTDKIPGFRQRLEKTFPGMQSHRCSYDHAGGFFKRIEEGTWMGHVIEHIALELQTMAGMDCGFGRTRGTGEHGVYNVVFDYMEAEAGKYAAEASVRIAQALVDGKEVELAEDIQTLREIRERERLGPSTGSLVDEAAKRGIPYIRLNRHSLVQLGYGINQKRVQATVASTTGNIAVEIACDKEETKALLDAANIPVPKGMLAYDLEDMELAVRRLGYPIVTKPKDGNHGRGATINIKNWEDAVAGFEAAKKHSRRVIVERFIEGLDHRLLVVNYQFIAGALRTPAAVTGDGKHTIRELVDITNSDPRRGYGHEKVLTEITIDAMSEKMVEEMGYTMSSVPKKDEVIYLKTTANLSTGGTSEDVTDVVHPYNVFMAERIARIIGLDICGIDILTHDISVPLHETRGAVIEVNAGPGFRMHLAPAKGIARNVAEPVIDMLFPPGSTARIPIIAITGTNGKTTTTRLTAHIMKTIGKKVGFTTTDGIYIQNRMVQEGDCTGPVSAEFVLKDPTVNFAVLECARGGILRAGLGFHKCDIAIVTNIAADHLGLKGINTVEEMAKVKGVVPETVMPEGYAILNADDDLVYEMRKNLQCKVALFSMDETNPRIVQHIRKGGYAAVAENGYVSIMKGEWKIRVEKITNIPLTMAGKAGFMIQNILPAVMASFIHGVKIEEMKLALDTFIPSPAQTPGRMNMFQFKDFTVVLDYAHNTAGFQAMSNYLEKVDAKPKVGIIAGVGDRRDEDIRDLGRVAAGMFDEIIIRQDKNMRGRPEGELIQLMQEGINEVGPSKFVKVIPKESDAINYALSNAVKDSFIVICSDVIPDALNLVMSHKEREDQGNLKKIR